jgi:hypothetical protein
MVPAQFEELLTPRRPAVNGLNIPSSQHAQRSKYIRFSPLPALFIAPFFGN